MDETRRVAQIGKARQIKTLADWLVEDLAIEELDLLIEDIESVTRSPEDVPQDRREQLVHVCAELIAALSR